MKSLIFYNGKIVTMDGTESASAVAVCDGVIIRVGSDDEILSLKQPDSEIVDLSGALVLPGFIDSHMHILNYGMTSLGVNLFDAVSVEDIVEKCRAFIKEHTGIKWLFGGGFNDDNFDVKRFPLREDLDRISTEIPVTLGRVCGHVTVCNSKALDVNGIDRDTKAPEGGAIDRDADGELTGVFRENAIGLLYANAPVDTKDDVKAVLRGALRDAAKCGLTSIQSDDLISAGVADRRDVINAYLELEKEEGLPVRVYEQCLIDDPVELSSFIADGYVTGFGDESFKIGPLKLIGDGSLGARTAYMKRPYVDAPDTRGIPCFTKEKLYELIELAHTNGMQCAVHCIGDAAMEMALDAYERVSREHPRADMRHGIVHCQITDAKTLERFKALNVLAYIQPVFLDYDLHIAEERVGRELAMTSYAWRTLMESGVHTSCGSDCPVEPFDVMKGIYCAVTRQDVSGFPAEGWNPDERLSVEQAVFGYTLGAVYASHEENIKGSITVGKLADMVMLERDIFTIPANEIKDVKVLATIKGGEFTFRL